MNKIILYIHGKGGNTAEAEHYKPLFPNCEVVGFDYCAQTPRDAKEEFPKLFDAICQNARSVEIVASSLGAFFSMCALSDKQIDKAYFISPVVDMEKLITDMMMWAHITEDELQRQKVIHTDFGETLSWEYLCYVKEHPAVWKIPTHILYGENDNLTSYETMAQFAEQNKATLTVMENGEHWFHTEEQMKFLDEWIQQYS